MPPERALDVRAARRREGGAARDGALVRRGVELSSDFELSRSFFEPFYPRFQTVNGRAVGVCGDRSRPAAGSPSHRDAVSGHFASRRDEVSRRRHRRRRTRPSVVPGEVRV